MLLLSKPKCPGRPLCDLPEPTSRRVRYKSHGGYSIAWSLLALAVMSSVIWSRQLQETYTLNRNLAAENRSLLLQEITLIQQTLSLCAISTRSKYAATTSSAPPVPAGFEPPADLWYPYSLNTMARTPLTDLVCSDQLSAGLPETWPRMFRHSSNQLLPVSGLQSWSYRNRLDASGAGELSFQISSVDSNGRALLQSLLQSSRRPAEVDNNSLVEDPNTGVVTLTIRLAGT
jgi:hypothetical protein